MPVRPATKPLPTIVCAAALLAAALVPLAGCASAPAPLDDEQLARMRAVEAAWRAGADDYPTLRDELVQDPVAAAWLVRILITDVLSRREGQDLGTDREFLRSAAGLEDPVATRAIAEIRALGAIAVPVLVQDLLHHDQPQPRELGIELLVHVGTPAVPALQQVARRGPTKAQRAAARALGRIGVDDQVLATLRELANDGDFTVRADALRALAGAGPDAQALLLERLRDDDDAFVRRVAAQALGNHRTRAAALGLVEFVERARRAQDRDGERAGQLALMQMAGERRPRTTPQWRQWARDLPETAPVTPPAPAR